MEKYKFTVQLQVEVEAFDINDAQSAVEDVFGLGDDYGVIVVASSISLTGSE